MFIINPFLPDRNTIFPSVFKLLLIGINLYYLGKLENAINPGEATNPVASSIARNINLGLGQLLDCLQGNCSFVTTKYFTFTFLTLHVIYIIHLYLRCPKPAMLLCSQFNLT